MSKQYIVFDTETNGLPLNQRAPITDLNNWPRIIQLAWAVYDEEGNEIESKCDLIKPDGWSIPVERFWIDNGYSTEANKEKGIPIATALGQFMAALKNSHTLVSHNMVFDYNIVGAELSRLNQKWDEHIYKVCTKEESTAFCKIPGRYNTYKWPKLDELHKILFQEGFANAHDALADVRACARCFFNLKHKQVIKIPVSLNSL